MLTDYWKPSAVVSKLCAMAKRPCKMSPVTFPVLLGAVILDCTRSKMVAPRRTKKAMPKRTP